MQREKVMQVLNDPLAQQLIWSDIPARVAYTGTDGRPRVVPLGFHWNGTRFIICTVPESPKVRALRVNPHVALTIDTVSFPPHVLLVRGTVSMDVVDGVPMEYLEAAKNRSARRVCPLSKPRCAFCTTRWRESASSHPGPSCWISKGDSRVPLRNWSNAKLPAR